MEEIRPQLLQVASSTDAADKQTAQESWESVKSVVEQPVKTGKEPSKNY